MKIPLPFAALVVATTCVSATAAPRVVATVLPVHGIVAAVMEGVGVPELLIEGSVSPHHYSMTPSARRKIDDAELAFGIGPAMEAGIWEAIEQAAANHVALMDFVDPRLFLTAEASAHDGDGVPDHAPQDLGAGVHQHADDHADHARAGANPHVWLDTGMAAEMAESIAHILADRDPENAAIYLANARSFHTTLDAVNAEIASELAGRRKAVAISYHDAFPWFARQWRLNYGYIVLEPELSPSAARVAEIREQAREGEIACLMTEPQFRPDLFAALAADFDLPVVEVDPVGNDIALGPAFYPQLMRRVGRAFATCLEP